MSLQLNNRMIARAMTNGILTLLDQDSGFEVHSAEFNSKQFTLLTTFASALNNNAPTAELVELFKKIEKPGFNAIYHLITRLVDERSKLQAKNLPKRVNPCPSVDQGISAQNSKQIQALLPLIKHESLTPAQKVNYAIILAKLDRPEEAKPIIAEAYEQDENLKDGYARVAWQYYWPKKEYDKVIEWMEKDLGQGEKSGIGSRGLYDVPDK